MTILFFEQSCHLKRPVSFVLTFQFLCSFLSSSNILQYGPPPDAVKATARHILVKTEDAISEVQDKLKGGESFTALAQECSTCPSGARGGSLGSFTPGTMAPEFDAVVFKPDAQVGVVMGPIETKFGCHLIVVDKRTGGGDWY